ncbi:MAG TPA: RIP metalloprotease RseP, partial [Plasticicumulans sp.]|nr:RIP metalloprotease RseP [Plasticicumulans sp.]
GLQDGDRIVSVDDQRVADWQDFATRVRAKPEADLRLQIERDGSPLSVRLRPVRIETAQGAVGQIGAFAAVPQSLADSLRVVVRYGPIDAAVAAVERTWEMSAFTLRMLGRMLTGRASLDNLSGPLTIAQMAGQSASIGLSAFLSFLALVSISLGVLNLLPVPVLDGGHLAWYAIETIKGSPVSEAVQSAGQRVGLAVLLVMMGLAFYNDLARLFGP